MVTPPKMHPKVIRQYLTDTQFLFHCHIKIKMTMELGEKYIDECFCIMKTVDKQYNSYSEGSYFNLINKNAGDWVEVDTDTISMLKHILEVHILTDGIYDIRMMPLLKLWGFYNPEINELPTQKNINETLEEMKTSRIEIDGNKVRIGKKGEIMTGSFIKAFAVDKAISFLKSEGVSDAIINAGGSTIYALNNDEHPFWTINIPHSIKQNSYWKQIFLENACFSLSGRKSHFVEIERKKYGHIINAKSGFPSKNLQAGTITKTAFFGDILSTALMANDSRSNVYRELQQQYVNFLSSSYVIDQNCKIQTNFINN